jgi:hypothetical protein
MNGKGCHACGRKISVRNRATHSIGGMVAGCVACSVACSGDSKSTVRARMLARSLGAADGLGYVPTRIARYMPRRYRAA